MLTNKPHAGFVAIIALAACAVVRAGDAVTWLDAVAERPVDHDVMIKGPFAAAHEKVALSGPVAVVPAEPAAEAGGCCLAAYRIAATVDDPVREVVVGGTVTVRLGPAEFLLVPAKRLADGPVAGAGDGSVYEARRILAGPVVMDGMPAGAGRPTHLCLPVDYRHHFERVPVADPGRGLALGAGREVADVPAGLAVADDFGIHRLTPGRTARAGAWVAVSKPPER